MEQRSRSELLTGWSGNESYFRFIEVDAEAVSSLESVIKVLTGEVLGVIYRNRIPIDLCREVALRFWNSQYRIGRGEEAPGDYVGVTHYLKDTDSYLKSVPSADAAMAVILGETTDPLRKFWEDLQAALYEVGVEYRLARKGVRVASRGLIRSLGYSDRYALQPHEDISQCADPRQSDFEIQKVQSFEIASVNLCLESCRGGKLIVWNIKPDVSARRRVGISYEGTSYSEEWLREFDWTTVEINAGDVYVFNTSHIHAVDRITHRGARRTAIAALFGFIGETTVVSWT